MKTLSEQGVRISNKKPCKAASTDNMLYGRFVKSATLTACGEEPMKLAASSESSEEEEEEKLDLSSARRLTDEELMRVCGGRTAHKGARHGLTMSAKLARLEEQERAFLAMYRHKERQDEAPESSPSAERQKKKKKGSKQSGDGHPEVLQEPNGEEEVAGEEGKVVKRKKKKKKKEKDKEKPVETEKKKKKEDKEPAETEKKKKKKKKKKEEDKEEPAETEKKKKKKKKEEEDKEEPAETEKKEDKEEPGETEVLLEDTDGPDQAGRSPRKKRKKRKREAE
uniref:G patch domain-containing protein 4 n=1 Tax=Bubo bubo TaxID=30461 RepID=A0A8C0ID44_BUBBB